ncbi:MAG: MoxR family ATPase [Thermoguttaceae bacterium]|nr:MoxR family ATPase [Thermoguttaceae bacterium]MDW8078346.1 MoxR family ATPase [Thermoguttaceae bacterium]
MVVEADLQAAINRCYEACQRLVAILRERVVGQTQLIEQVLTAFLAQGHVLVEGASGVGRSLIVSTLAKALQGSFRQIFLSPDLVAADLVGREVLIEDQTTGQRRPHLEPGPIFANFVVVRDIQFALPRIQSLLMEALETGMVTVAGRQRELPRPFLVLATQNPAIQHEIHPLPYEHLDRFLFFVKADYPSAADEWRIARSAQAKVRDPEPLLTLAEWQDFADLVDKIVYPERLLGYTWALVRASRPRAADSPDFVDRWIASGASTRGLVAFVRAAKARALLCGRAAVGLEDIQAVVKPILRHRITPNEAAEAQALSSDALIDMIMEAVRPDRTYPPPELSGD